MHDWINRLADQLAAKGTSPGPPVGLRPVVVGSTGRSGTTLMMRLLGSSDLIAFDRIYAYENSYLLYLWRWANTPESGARQAPNWRRAALDQEDALGDPGFVGAIPWSPRPPLDDPNPPLADDLLRAAWAIFSSRASAHHERELGRPPTHYAEVAPPWFVGRVSRVLTVKACYLIRDPRDQWVSMVRFMEKTGRRSFGFKRADTPETFARRIARQQRGIFRIVQTVEEDDDTRVLRYERLVEDLEGQAERLGAWLGLSLRPDRLHAADTEHSDHRTSTQGGSVGRWRREMEPPIVEIFDEVLGPELTDLGYERS